MVRRRATTILLVVLMLFASATVAYGATAEKDVGSGCRIGAQAYEHWTKARHVSYDDNYGCGDLYQYHVRRCWGTNKYYWSGWISTNRIDKQYAGCDAIYTKTSAKDYSGNYLGFVDVWA